MNILMLTSETVPFSKSGGLADVVGALSAELAKAGHEVTVFMPLYGSVSQEGFAPESSMKIRMLARDEQVKLKVRTLSGVRFLALDHPLFTRRKGIYGDSSFAPYPDNFYRFSLMCKAAVRWACEHKVDIIHAHDWTAGLACYLAKQEKNGPKSVMTIHNLAYMGQFPRYDALRSGFLPSGRMLCGNGLTMSVNLLKTGLEYADRITTVSPTYAKEIQTAEQGCGLDELLRQKQSILYGVINGIDTQEWNPETDSFFSEHYSIADLSGKRKVKEKVQKQFALEVNPDIPLFAMISRLAEQKGFGPLLDGDESALERILSTKRCQFIVIGTGDSRYEDKLRQIASRHANLSVNIVFSQALSHLVEAGADFFLMPSKYEPCGLNQMYSLRYGTLPVAHRTGGLNDTITDISSAGENGNGFLFDNVFSDEIVAAVSRAVDFYRDKSAMEEAMKNGMRADFSWGKSAHEYELIYKNALGGNQT